MTARRPVNLPPRIDWDSLPVHPAAEKLPIMDDAGLKALAADIEAHGLQEPIIVWRDNREAANGSEGPFPRYLLDGRNRLAALKLLGIDNPEHAPRGRLNLSTVHTVDAMRMCIGDGKPKRYWKPNVDDPASFVRSMNVHRRHLTAEQKRAAIADHIKLDPAASDREIGRKVGVDKNTAAKVRDDLEARGEIHHVEKRTDSMGRQQPANKPKPPSKPRRRRPIDELMLDKLDGSSPAKTEAEAPIDWNTLPGTMRAKVERIARQIHRELEAKFELRLEADVKAHVAPLQRLANETYTNARCVLDARKGIMTKADYDLIRSCLHPDSRLSASDEKLAKAFRVFNELELLFLNEKDFPTTRTLPSWEELVKMRAQKQEEQKRRRGAKS